MESSYFKLVFKASNIYQVVQITLLSQLTLLYQLKNGKSLIVHFILDLHTFLACLSLCMTSDEILSMRFPDMMIVSHSELLTSVSWATLGGIWWNLLKASTNITSFFSCRISLGMLDRWLLCKCKAWRLYNKENNISIYQHRYWY